MASYNLQGFHAEVEFPPGAKRAIFLGAFWVEILFESA